MKFDVCGGFEIQRKLNRHGVFDRGFWESVADHNSDLPSACGCYIFALQNGNSIIPWYVGKTEKMTFQKECFQPAKINYYNEVLIDKRGKPLIYLIPRLTTSGKKFSSPTRSGYKYIDFLETMLIGMALERNRGLMNIQKTKLLREMIVPGVINSPQSRPTKSVSELRNALGLIQG